MAGNDLRKMTDDVKAVLTTQEAIAVDQDLLGHLELLTDQGRLVILLPACQRPRGALGSVAEFRQTGHSRPHLLELER